MSRIFLLAFLTALVVCVSAWKAPLIKKETALAKLEREGYLSVAKRIKNKMIKGHTRFDRLDSVKQHMGQHNSGYYSYRYTVPIGIGTPVQQFNVYVDITSADFWVKHVSCESMGGNCDDGCQTSCHAFGCMGCCGQNEKPCDGQHKFDDARSSTYKQMPDRWSPNFESDIPIYGFYAQDTVTLGGGSDSISIPSTNFELATFEDSGIIDSDLSDGILGLAFKSLSTAGNTTTVLENAVAQNLLDQPLFSIWLDPNSKFDEAGGQISFGEVDRSYCDTSKLVNFPVFQESFWVIGVDALYLNEKSITNERVVTLSFDLNQPEILMSYDDLDQLVAKLGATFDFDAYAYAIDCSAKFTWGLSSDSSLVLNQDQLFVRKASDGKNCILPFAADWERGGEYILGEPWMRNFCSVFNLGKKTVGLAPVKNSN